MIQTIEMTDIGNGRPSNQDAYLIKKGKHEGKQCLLAAVCDGMGGLRRGEIASRYIIELLKQWFDEVLPGLIRKKKIDRIQKDLIGLIKKSNENLLLMSEDTDETMGSTLTLLFVLGEQFFVLNVGDSRAYWFEQGRKYVTTDHTLAQLEVKAGHMTREQARRDPRRHILIQCVGVTKDIKIDCYRGRIEPGMEFLLCTDGFYGRLEEEEIYHVDSDQNEMRMWVEDCFRKVKERGELDNLSCILIKVP